MSDLRWKSEPPTEPGVYWVRVKDVDGKEVFDRTHVTFSDGKPSLNWPDGRKEYFSVSEVIYWIGPVAQRSE